MGTKSAVLLENLENIDVAMPASQTLMVPYNHQPELLDALAPVADRVSALYLDFHPEIAYSAREYRGPAKLFAYLAALDELVDRAGAMGIGVNLVANVESLPVDLEALVRVARNVYERAPRFWVTFSSLAIAKEARKMAPWMEIAVSTLAFVSTPVEAMWWKERTGATRLVVAREINRMPARLESFQGLGMTLGVVVFDECVPNCPVHTRHYVPPGHLVKPGQAVGWAAAKANAGSGACDCGMELRWRCDPDNERVRRERPWLLAQKEILPGHLKHLDGLVSEIKIAGRAERTTEIIRRVRLYLEARSLAHPIGFYEEVPEAWDELARCARDCHRCNWCRENLIPGKGKVGTASISWFEEVAGRADWWFRLHDGDGLEVLIWAEQPQQGRRPPFQVGGRGLYYTVRGGMAEDRVLAILRDVRDGYAGAEGSFDPRPADRKLRDVAEREGVRWVSSIAS